MIWIVFAAMIAVVLAMLLVPLLRARPVAEARAEHDLAVYRDQLAEIDRDLERGVLTADQADAARTEIQRRLLGVAADTRAAVKYRRPVATAVIITLIVTLISSGLYMRLGSPNLPDQPFSARAAKIHDMKDKVAAFQGMVDKLSARLQADPKDGKGWAMLGRSLKVLGQPEQAAEAFDKAVALLPGDAQVRMEYAMLMLDDIPQGAVLPPRLVALMREILALDATNPDALYFVGIAESQSGHPDKARALWQKIIDQLPPDSTDRAELLRQMEGLK
jgi:cytochrome c-type biogenesis protein CcmH